MRSKLTPQKKNDLLSAGCAILAVALLYLFFHFSGIGCPLHFLTGINCPGCGMSRACIALLCLRFHDAWHYHPLVYSLPFALLVYLFRKKMPLRIYHILIFTFIALFVTIYLVRMLDPTCDIVTFQPEQGFIFRTIKFLFT